MKYLTLILIFLAIPLISQASSGLRINLSYNEGVLSLREPVAQEDKTLYFFSTAFDEQAKNNKGPYTLIIRNWDNKDLVRMQFNTLPGNFSLNVPYYPTIKALEIIENSSQKTILEKSLEELSTCNANEICEFEKGENGSSCIVDCGVSNPKYSKETKQLLAANNGSISDEKGVVVLKDTPQSSASAWAIVTIVILATGAIAFIIIRRRRNEK